ncbi:hypothetical protein FBQ81_05015 [Chloroflexi bacterium CFX6]|nr:hypothetical protein [Chloroflexi bacterium CFX6]
MNTNKSQRGQALILIAFGIVALVGFTALAVDGGRVFSDRRNAQNAADTSALAAALKYIREIENNPGSAKDLAKTEAEARAASNNYTTDTDSMVTVVFCDEVTASSDPCDLPSGSDETEYLRVTIVSNVPMTFGRVLGREFVTNKVEAITRVQGTKTTGIFDAGAGMYSIKSGNFNDCFELLGNADLVFHNTGIFVNCSGSDALALGGSYGLTMDANARVVGCSRDKDDVPPPIQGTGQIDCGVDEQEVKKETFKDVPTTEPTPTCSTPGNHDTINNILTPGYHPTRNISSDTTLSPGVYCFPSGSELKFQAGASITGTSSTDPVKLVLSSDTDLKGSANNFKNLEVYTDNSSFQIFGTLHADRFRFFGNGNSTFGVQSGEFISGNAYIYTESGEIDIRAQAHVDITAPPPGDKFGGLLMYMPWDNPNNFTLNGGSDDIWRGTVLMPGAEVRYNGGAGFELHGQVIAETFKINGGAEGDIYFSSDYIFSPPSDPTIEFTK